MKKKRIEYRKYPGLKVLCKDCGYEIHNIGESGLKTDCRHPMESQVYKAVLKEPGTGRRKTKNLTASTFQEAVEQVNRFKAELENPVPAAMLRKEEEKRSDRLLDCIARYLDYLSGVGVPKHLKRERDKMYLDNMRRYSAEFVMFLKNLKIDISKVGIEEITEEIVGEYHEYAEAKTNKKSMYNHRFRPLKGLYKYLIHHENRQITDPFKDIKKKSEKIEPKSFTLEEIEKIKAVISPHDDYRIVGKKKQEKKHMYREWLTDAIDLALFTGVRREQIMVMKWSDVECFPDGTPKYIKSNNLKVNRMLNRNGDKDDKYVYAPIYAELRDLLYQMGFEEKRGSDEYIIAPKEKASREWLVKRMSWSFSFFSEKAGLDPKLGFKYLRKTNITEDAKKEAVRNIIKRTGHSKESIVEDHYLDASAVATSITESNLSLFGKGGESRKQSSWPVHASAVDANQGE